MKIINLIPFLLILLMSCAKVVDDEGVSSTATGSLFVQFGATTTAGGSNAGNDKCRDVAVDGSGNIYCAGTSYGHFSGYNAGYNDIIIIKFNSGGELMVR